MTRGEAVDYIKEWLKDEYSLNSKDRIVLTMAIQYINDTSTEYVNTPTDLVSRQDAIKTIKNAYNPKNNWVNRDGIIRRINQIPSANRHNGKWEHEDGVYGIAFCPFCEFELRMNDTNFCPNCGARMKGEEE